MRNRFFEDSRKTIALLRIFAAGIFLCFSFSIPASYSDENVRVSASVGPIGTPPAVTSIVPGSSPVLVARNKIQTFSLQISDPDSANIVYTVTPGSGAIIANSGTLGVVSGWTRLDFTYFAPSTKAGLVSIVVTLDDLSGSQPVVATINAYIY